MLDGVLPCLRSRPGNTVYLIPTTYRRGQCEGRRDGPGAAQGQSSIPSCQLVADMRTDPRSREELTGDVPDQQIWFLYPRVGIVLQCPLR